MNTNTNKDFGKDKNIELLPPGQLQPNTSNLKASLFNLVIFTHEPRRTAYFQDIAQMIAKQFPCRIIFIQADNSVKEPYLRVKLQNNKDKFGMNCDFISIEVGGSYLDRVRFLILPYFITDLPIYLLWGQDPTIETAILPYLQNDSTRLVFDPECSENLQKFSQRLLKQHETSPVEITDMDWARLRGWREVLNKVFDCQERIDQLNSSKIIKIIYNNRPSDPFFHPQTQAFYFQAWLAAQLKWEFVEMKKENDNTTLYYTLGKHQIKIILQGESRQHLPTEEILEFEASNQSNFLYCLTHKGENQVLVHCNTIDRCELPFTLFLPNISSGRTFMQEIFYKKTSEQYFHMLKMISTIHGNSQNGKI
ncbi:MAG: glucose-6-phosphate dehydrogenase assembly protein OpcA [Parachlamydiaceae bacterium]|nr:glucose-6-phosphate dehydrogenase assembly protein OpcA [Parachlamydiaceae bacterium]